MLIDTHSHIYFDNYKNDINQVIERAYKNNVKRIICVGTDIKSSIESIDISKKFKNVYATIGIHPHDTDKVDDDYIKKLKSLSHEEKVVAIGETGLDYYYNNSKPKNQKKCFIEHIKLSKSLDLPVVIHNRDSDKDMIDILNEYTPKGVVHCFNGSIQLAQKITDLGLFISFTGIITFKNSHLSDLIKNIDLSNIMIETDSPYLTPIPYRGKRNEPSYVYYVAQKIADIKNISIKEVEEASSTNALRLFNKLK